MEKLSAIFHLAANAVKKGFNHVTGSIMNVYAALVHPNAMKPEERHIDEFKDEFKLLAGGVITGAGVVVQVRRIRHHLLKAVRRVLANRESVQVFADRHRLGQTS